MKLALRIRLSLILGIATGLGATWFSLRAGISAFEERRGFWITSRDFGSADASDRARSIVALRGLMALPAREAIYFNAATIAKAGCWTAVAGIGSRDRRWRRAGGV